VNPSSSKSGKTQVSRVMVVALSLPRASRALKAFQWINASENAFWISSLSLASRPKSDGR
jgi:hypothetical protein